MILLTQKAYFSKRVMSILLWSAGNVYSNFYHEALTSPRYIKMILLAGLPDLQIYYYFHTWR